MVSSDKNLGGISTMIQISSEALSINCRIINLVLSSKILKNKSFLESLKNIKNLLIQNINSMDRIFFKFGYLSSSIKDKLKESDIIFCHNSKLLKLIRDNFPHKKIILFFHTDKLSQLKDLRYADKVVTVNSTMKKKINTMYSKKAIYIPNSLNRDKSNVNQLYRKRNYYNKNNIVVGAMGRLVKKKGFEFLVKVCMEMDNVELLIAGNGKEMGNLKNISFQKESIKLLGWIENKDSFFKKIDVFCSSSNEEPFGLVIIEAMARGIPIISTNCNGPIDIIKNNKDGLLIEKNNKIELKNAITKLKDNVNLRGKLGLSAFNKCKNKFTFKEYLKNITFLIKTL